MGMGTSSKVPRTHSPILWPRHFNDLHVDNLLYRLQAALTEQNHSQTDWRVSTVQKRADRATANVNIVCPFLPLAQTLS